MPDPIYRSVVVTQLVNKVLLRGQRSTSEHIVYKALDEISRKTGGDPVTVLKRAVENVRPQLEVKSRRVGGATYQVPVEVRPRRADPAIRSSAIPASGGESRGRAELSGPAASARRSSVRPQKMAESNKAFSITAVAGRVRLEHEPCDGG
jgi:small subunit ribosomal protein S7